MIRDHTVGTRGTGAVALIKAGTGTWVLSGANTYTGPTTLTSGQLVLAGKLASNLTANGGTLAPNGTPATTGSVTIGSASLFQVRINGPTVGTQYDQLTAAGAVTLGGSLNIVAGDGLPLGTSFVILNKTSLGAVSGTFAGMPDGSLFTAGGYLWQINYAGGDGNDVVLRTTTGLETWCVNQFGTLANTGSAADGADYDGDGVLNLVEYAFGLNPKDASSNQIPTPQVSGGNFTVSFMQPADVSGITYHAEWSATLANDWVEIADSDPSPAGFTFSVPMGTNTKMFVRYRITSP